MYCALKKSQSQKTLFDHAAGLMHRAASNWWHKIMHAWHHIRGQQI